MPLKALGDTQLTGRALASGDQTSACNWLAPLSQPPRLTKRSSADGRRLLTGSRQLGKMGWPCAYVLYTNPRMEIIIYLRANVLNYDKLC
jgi:hypothetical protein